jgi:hypothetical protein
LWKNGKIMLMRVSIMMDGIFFGCIQRILRIQAESLATQKFSAIKNSDIFNIFNADVIGNNAKVITSGPNSQSAISEGGDITVSKRNVIVFVVVFAFVASIPINVPIQEVNGVKVAESSIFGLVANLASSIVKFCGGKSS